MVAVRGPQKPSVSSTIFGPSTISAVRGASYAYRDPTGTWCWYAIGTASYRQYQYQYQYQYEYEYQHERVARVVPAGSFTGIVGVHCQFCAW